MTLTGITKRLHSITKPIFCALAVLALATTGCMTGRTTTTPRSAVEQALLSQTAEASIQRMNFNELSGKSYCLKKDFFNAIDGEYILGTLNKQLLDAGLTAADDDKSSTTNLIIYPTVAHAAVDDSSLLIGLPEIPLSMPGAGAVLIPEAAFFKYNSQKGCNRMMVYAKDAKTKKLVFTTEIVSSQRHYDRWVILFLISFRDTDLKAPH